MGSLLLLHLSLLFSPHFFPVSQFLSSVRNQREGGEAYVGRVLTPLLLSLHAHVLSHSVVSDSLRPPWTVAPQAPLYLRFTWHEYWSGLPFPTPGDLPDPGINPESPAPPALAGG